MAGRPAKICKLVKGKLIDAQAGFVDTFNWMLDFVDNLKGEGEIGAANSTLKVDRTISDRPVIRGGGASGGGPLIINGTDGSSVQLGEGSASDAKTITFAAASNCDNVVTVTGGGSSALLTIGVYYS